MRKNGYYWVKLFNEWTIAVYYGGGSWGQVLGYIDVYTSDSDFQEIDETPIKRPLTKEQLKEQHEALLKTAKHIQDSENQ